MTKIPFIHDKKDKKNLVNTYYYALIPLLLFGIYKNGILLYNHELVHLKSIFIPIYFYFISIIIGIFISFIRKEKKLENILLAFIITSTISINMNMLLYPILLFVTIFILKYLKDKFPGTFNISAASRMIVILGLLMGSYSYLNIAEKLDQFNYNLFDIFLGHGVGGIASTSCILVLLAFLILIQNRFYKKMIPIAASCTYILIILIGYFVTQNENYFIFMLNGSVYFSFVFIAADIDTSPNHRKGMILYGILIGLFTSIFMILGLPYEASYLSITLISFFIPFINKLMNRKYLKTGLI